MIDETHASGFRLTIGTVLQKQIEEFYARLEATDADNPKKFGTFHEVGNIVRAGITAGFAHLRNGSEPVTAEHVGELEVGVVLWAARSIRLRLQEVVAPPSPG